MNKPDQFIAATVIMSVSFGAIVGALAGEFVHYALIAAIAFPTSAVAYLLSPPRREMDF